jgi:shikimate dehydrogenase
MTAPADIIFFVGVSTASSQIMRVFPDWAEALGVSARIVGMDLAIGSPPESYRAVVERIAGEERACGALITSHKAALFEHARQLFDQLDGYAELCREVSCISRRAGSLVGLAKDPITARLALQDMLGLDPWARSEGQVVCLGAGGAGVAICVALMAFDPPPARIVLADVDPARIEVAGGVRRRLPSSSRVELRLAAGPEDNDRLIASVPPGSLVINATGMGKDLPGSPVTRAVQFPRDGIAWDLNYRGDLPFLDAARRARAARRLRVLDGWRYFVHGWTQVIAEVLDVPIDRERLDLLVRLAERHGGASSEQRTRTAGRNDAES